MLKSSKNYYEILGVTPDIEDTELKSVYRRLVRKYHPDINPDGELKFKDILEAYETLCDEKKRKQYDILNGFFKSTGTASAPKSEPYRKSYRTNSDNKTSCPKDTFEKSKENKTSENNFKQKATQAKNDKNFTDLINDIIDGFSQKPKNKKQSTPKPPTPKNGEDIYADVVITLKESITETHKTVNILQTEVCKNCNGRKFINGSKCTHCGGSGEVMTRQRINVTIPKNIKNGAKLRLAGEGKKGKNGGKNGNLYLKITIEPDSAFKIDGNDLICEVPISPFEAVLGGDIEIPSFEENVTLSLPPKTKSGQIFRISSKGLRQNNLVGDIIVTVKVQIPDKISDEEIQLYEKLKNLAGQNIRENFLND